MIEVAAATNAMNQLKFRDSVTIPFILVDEIDFKKLLVVVVVYYKGVVSTEDEVPVRGGVDDDGVFSI